jgi:hypothetical protein
MKNHNWRSITRKIATLWTRASRRLAAPIAPSDASGMTEDWPPPTSFFMIANDTWREAAPEFGLPSVTQKGSGRRNPPEAARRRPARATRPPIRPSKNVAARRLCAAGSLLMIPARRSWRSPRPSSFMHLSKPFQGIGAGQRNPCRGLRQGLASAKGSVAATRLRKLGQPDIERADRPSAPSPGLSRPQKTMMRQQRPSAAKSFL